MSIRLTFVIAFMVLLLASACRADGGTANRGEDADWGENPETTVDVEGEGGDHLLDEEQTAGLGSPLGGSGLRDVPDESMASSTIEPTIGSGGEVGVDTEVCSSDANPRFTHSYTDLDQIEFINPTIVTSGNWLKNRQYHKVVTDTDNQAALVPVYAPTDAMAVGITHYLGTMQPWVGEPFEIPQFDVRFQVSCEVAFWFDHLSELVEPLASLAAPDRARDTRDAQVPVRVDVKAGDLVGYTSGTEPAHTWDFVLINLAKKNRFANQSRYEQTGDLHHLLHADCPFDYFDEPLRSEYRSRFGSWQGRVAGFGCDFEVDVVGTMAGGWFLTPFEPSDGSAIADWGFVAKIAADGAVDLNGPRVSIRTMSGAATFADPKTITGEHCFQDYKRPDRHAYVKVISNSEVAVTFGDGTCPASLPDDHQVFHR